MIKINLAKRRKAAGTGFDFKNINLSSLLGSLKGAGGDGERKRFDLNSPLAKLAVGLIAIYFVDDTLTAYRADALKTIDAQIAEIDKEREAVEKKLAKIKGFEPIKKQLEDDERAVRTKLEVVTELLENRDLPAKMLMQIAQVIPRPVWLTGMSLSSDRLKLAGGTPGHGEVSDFINALSSTPYLAEVSLKGVQESTTADKDQKYQTFDLEARRR